MRIFALLGIVLFGTSCGGKVRPDPFPASSKSNFPSAEFKADGKLWNGLGFAELKKGESFEQVGLEIQTYYKGTLKIVGRDCGVNEVLRYGSSMRLPYKIPGIANKSCLVSFTVSPEFPGEQNQEVIVTSVEGHLFIRVSEPEEEWYGRSAKIREGGYFEFQLPAQGYELVPVLAEGCGKNIDENFFVEHGTVRLPVTALVDQIIPRSCIVHGAYFLGQEVRFFSLMIWIYSKDYVVLPRPFVSAKGKRKVLIEAADQVSVVSFGLQFEIDNEGTFEIPEEGDLFPVRALTVGGRTSLGEWHRKYNFVQWIP